MRIGSKFAGRLIATRQLPLCVLDVFLSSFIFYSSTGIELKIKLAGTLIKYTSETRGHLKRIQKLLGVKKVGPGSSQGKE